MAALYHLSAKVGKVSPVAHDDYIERSEKFSKYQKAEELLYSKSMNMPSWADKGRDFLEATAQYEKRLPYREWEIALPNELFLKDNIKLVEGFIGERLKNKHACTYAIHKSKGKLSGQDNVHVHIMFSEREIDSRKDIPKEIYFKQYSKKKSGELTGGFRKNRQLHDKK